MGLYLVFWITIFLAFQAQVACYVTPGNHLRARSTPTSVSQRASTPSDSVQTPPSNAHNGSSSEVAVIVAVCLGTVLLAVIGLIIIFFVLRRRKRRSLPVALGNMYAFAPPSTASPTPSRSWLLRKFGNNSGDDLSTNEASSANPSWPDTINFYHTPRAPPKAFVKKSSHLAGGGSAASNGTEISLSSMSFSPKTERQMEIEERIEELQGKLALLQRTIRVPGGRPDSRTLINMTHNMRIGKWRNQIETLQELMGSDWALGRTDVIPKGLYTPKSIV
ncbi:hypothetical protein BT96DRAFT_1085953 [Gymnopus androsaceus JB14]|uniref:Mid2 domain-containing protein n=1 Tax=Gymnopus androsaceus JB14 TaxID=1447944 RepID=A0A6A4HYD7_9AGAR|nr:hypothetical protein BT96DRAFT_1085953 [Gymnopus androsaceus JB14]